MKQLTILLAVFFLLVTGCTTMTGPASQEKDQATAKGELIQFTDTSWWEAGEDPRLRTFHIRYGEEKNAMFEGLLKFKVGLVEGVYSIFSTPYRLDAWCAPVYTWDEIQPKIKELILEFEKAEIEETEVVEGDI